jgi:hypothetical protein
MPFLAVKTAIWPSYKASQGEQNAQESVPPEAGKLRQGFRLRTFVRRRTSFHTKKRKQKKGSKKNCGPEKSGPQYQDYSIFTDDYYQPAQPLSVLPRHSIQ